LDTKVIKKDFTSLPTLDKSRMYAFVSSPLPFPCYNIFYSDPVCIHGVSTSPFSYKKRFMQKNQHLIFYISRPYSFIIKHDISETNVNQNDFLREGKKRKTALFG
jgi:hypothetical protein